MNGTDKFVAPLLSDGYLAEALELNTDLLDTNLINLAVVSGVLVYFGRRVLTALLSERRQNILTTVRYAEERYRDAVERVNSAKARFEQMKERANQMRVDSPSRMRRELEEISQASDDELRRLDHLTMAALQTEERGTVKQLRRQIIQPALDRALQALRARLDHDLHTRIIDSHIALLATVDNAAH
jgi:F-type H+-transporting ATPase subunit b